MTDIKSLLKRAWMKLGVDIAKTLYRDDARRLELAYAVEDPWNMSSSLEQRRFEAVNQIIQETLGPVKSILEIGSGEGHQTELLLKLGAKVDAIELSSRAIERAKKRAGAARFFQARFPDLPAGILPRYDLVVASEALYYMSDIPKALRAINSLGTHGLATFYQNEIPRLSPYFEEIPGVLRKDIRGTSSFWRLYLWNSDQWNTSPPIPL